MADFTRLMFIQFSMYFIALILSVILYITMEFHQNQFRDHCALYTTGIWRESDQQFVPNWASNGYCNYVKKFYIGIIAISMWQMFNIATDPCRGPDHPDVCTICMIMITSPIIAVMNFIALIFILQGFSIWCTDIGEKFPNCFINGQDIDKADNIDTSGFFLHYNILGWTVLLSFILWMGLCSAAIKIYQLCCCPAVSNEDSERSSLLSST